MSATLYFQYYVNYFVWVYARAGVGWLFVLFCWSPGHNWWIIPTAVESAMKVGNWEGHHKWN